MTNRPVRIPICTSCGIDLARAERAQATCRVCAAPGSNPAHRRSSVAGTTADPTIHAATNGSATTRRTPSESATPAGARSPATLGALTLAALAMVAVVPTLTGDGGATPPWLGGSLSAGAVAGPPAGDPNGGSNPASAPGGTSSAASATDPAGSAPSADAPTSATGEPPPPGRTDAATGSVPGSSVVAVTDVTVAPAVDGTSLPDDLATSGARPDDRRPRESSSATQLPDGDEVASAGPDDASAEPGADDSATALVPPSTVDRPGTTPSPTPITTPITTPASTPTTTRPPAPSSTTPSSTTPATTTTTTTTTSPPPTTTAPPPTTDAPPTTQAPEEPPAPTQPTEPAP